MTSKFANNKVYYIYPWLIMIVFCTLVLIMLSMVFDSDRMSKIWWIVSLGGIVAAGCCNIFEYMISRFKN